MGVFWGLMSLRKDSCEFGSKVGVVAADKVLDEAGGPGMPVADLGVRAAVRSCWLDLRDLRPGVDADLGPAATTVGFRREWSLDKSSYQCCVGINSGAGSRNSEPGLSWCSTMRRRRRWTSGSRERDPTGGNPVVLIGSTTVWAFEGSQMRDKAVARSCFNWELLEGSGCQGTLQRPLEMVGAGMDWPAPHGAGSTLYLGTLHLWRVTTMTYSASVRELSAANMGSTYRKPVPFLVYRGVGSVRLDTREEVPGLHGMPEREIPCSPGDWPWLSEAHRCCRCLFCLCLGLCLCLSTVIERRGAGFPHIRFPEADLFLTHALFLSRPMLCMCRVLSLKARQPVWERVYSTVTNNQHRGHLCYCVRSTLLTTPSQPRQRGGGERNGWEQTESPDRAKTSGLICLDWRASQRPQTFQNGTWKRKRKWCRETARRRDGTKSI
ncbi:hypothetical protein C8035_v002111 [Colletotrichum spinosum]|uniref:Uncharacterized protein n=1 Tax=Colletotrichum spinosum TaxID=1347390 RepID=A0A4R8QT16_9PEZI|nr:hypothetical protein C8035_v002111 [Colletotrichum spinosum]